MDTQKFSRIAFGRGGSGIARRSGKTQRPTKDSKSPICDAPSSAATPWFESSPIRVSPATAKPSRPKPYLKPMVLFYKDYLLGEDPTDVERVMLKIRRLGAFKPWGSAVSAIEIALWDIAGQVAGVPVYKLLGGKIRDRVRIYNGGFRPP